MRLPYVLLAVLLAVGPAEAALAQTPHLVVDGPVEGENTGWSMAGGGDLDGDGVGDILAGTPRGITGGTHSGIVYAYSGSTGAILYSVAGALPDDDFGVSVAFIADVDGDGLDDFVAGENGRNPGASPFSHARVCSGLDGSIVFVVYDTESGTEFGGSVSGAGDLNGDGTPDFLVGSYSSPSAPDGAVYAFSGTDGILLHKFLGDVGRAWFGWSVSGAGDVDGDGCPEIIAGGKHFCPGTGYARVFSGKTGNILYTWDGLAPDDDFGISVAGLDDVNGDGVPDFLIGAEQDGCSTPDDPGYAQVRSGADGGLLYQVEGDAATDDFGHAVANPGDVNGDGYGDFLVGAWQLRTSPNQAGYARLYSGRDGSVLFDLRGRFKGDRFGNAVSGAGDIDGDGLSDFLIAARGTDRNGTGTGSVYAYLGAEMILTGSPGIAGAVNDLVVVDATPGQQVLFGAGRSAGSFPVPGCARFGPRHRRSSAPGRFDRRSAGAGRRSVDLVPGSAQGITVYVRALEPATCTLSNLMVATLQ